MTADIGRQIRGGKNSSAWRAQERLEIAVGSKGPGQAARGLVTSDLP